MKDVINALLEGVVKFLRVLSIKTQAAAKLLECGDEGILEAYVLYASPLFQEKILGARNLTALTLKTFLL